jgi:hypothetical protein
MFVQGPLTGGIGRLRVAVSIILTMSMGSVGSLAFAQPVSYGCDQVCNRELQTCVSACNGTYRVGVNPYSRSEPPTMLPNRRVENGDTERCMQEMGCRPRFEVCIRRCGGGG